MSSTEVVSTNDLTPGMHVVELDRPWLETPFLFQGFVIKDQQEIEELRRYCRFVHIKGKDVAGVTRQRSSRLKPHAPATQREGWMRRVLHALRKPTQPKREPPPGDFYTDSVDLKTELAQAKETYRHASVAFGDMMDSMRRGGKLDLSVLDSIVSPMIDSILRNRDAMTWLSRIKQTDDYTYGHSVSCSIYAIAFGRHLGLPKADLETLGLGGLLLDVGKTRIPKELLGKTAKLTTAEMDCMRSHVHHSVAIVSENSAIDARVLDMVKSHHERYDGGGYPSGLKGTDISVFARIGGIVDSFDALTTPRPYAAAVSAFDAMRELHKRANTEFQAEMVEQFIQTVGIFPNGAIVELSTGEVGIVVEQNRVRRLRPRITVILDRDKKPLSKPHTISLQDMEAEPDRSNAVWIDRGLELGAHGIRSSDYFL